MGLEKCPDCGNMISDSAEACIHCGGTNAPSNVVVRIFVFVVIVICFFAIKLWPCPAVQTEQTSWWTESSTKCLYKMTTYHLVFSKDGCKNHSFSK